MGFSGSARKKFKTFQKKNYQKYLNMIIHVNVYTHDN